MLDALRKSHREIIPTWANSEFQSLENIEFEFAGLGGARAMRHGLNPLFPLTKMAVNGILDVLLKSFFLWNAYHKILKSMRDFKPDLVLLVDYPGMNLRLAKKAQAAGFPVLFIAPPQVWVYRNAEKRLKKISRFLTGCDVHVLFPFEAANFKSFASSVSVGHFWVTGGEGEVKNNQIGERKTFLLCPGSRWPVLMRNLPNWLRYLKNRGYFAGNSRQIETHFDARFEVLIPEAMKEKLLGWLEIYEKGFFSDKISLSTDKEKSLAKANWAIVFPGTMTLELALHIIPFMVFAIIDPLTFWMGKKVLKPKLKVGPGFGIEGKGEIDIARGGEEDPILGLPNLLLEERVFPEWAGKVTKVTENFFQQKFEKLLVWNGDWEQILQGLGKKMGKGNGCEKVIESIQKILLATKSQNT